MGIWCVIDIILNLYVMNIIRMKQFKKRNWQICEKVFTNIANWTDLWLLETFNAKIRFVSFIKSFKYFLKPRRFVDWDKQGKFSIFTEVVEIDRLTCITSKSNWESQTNSQRLNYFWNPSFSIFGFHSKRGWKSQLKTCIFCVLLNFTEFRGLKCLRM